VTTPITDSAEFDVVVVGSANLDLVAHLDHLPKPGETQLAIGYEEHAGGKGLNQAVACARMGAKTAFVGCVGDDDAGAMLRGVLEREGIDISLVDTVDAPTGRAFINVDRHGENEIVVVSGANALVKVPVLPKAAVVLLQLEIPLDVVDGVLRAAKAAGSITVLNPAPATDVASETLALVDVLLPNETESAALGGTAVLLGRGVTTIVTTLGERGAVIETASRRREIAPFLVTPIDTVGAGDAFTGALCSQLAMGRSLEDAARIGAVAGALATTTKGAVPSLPTREAVFMVLGEPPP
jgi:ribokinase